MLVHDDLFSAELNYFDINVRAKVTTKSYRKRKSLFHSAGFSTCEWFVTQCNFEQTLVLNFIFVAKVCLYFMLPWFSKSS